MEAIINNEVEEFSNFLSEETKKNGDVIEMHNFYNISILNALWRIISGLNLHKSLKTNLILTYDLLSIWGDIIHAHYFL